MGQIILAHSVLRWVLVIIALSTIIKLALVCVRLTEHSRLDRVLSSSVAGIMDVQVVLGVTILAGQVSGYGFSGIIYVLPHSASMVFAVITTHLASRWAKTPHNIFRALVAMVISLLLVVAGVHELPRGWMG